MCEGLRPLWAPLQALPVSRLLPRATAYQPAACCHREKGCRTTTVGPRWGSGVLGQLTTALVERKEQEVSLSGVSGRHRN